jgi:hypothetical protein
MAFVDVLQQDPGDSRVRLGAYILGAVLALAAVAVTLASGGDQLHAKGPPNTGHETLDCADCHLPAPGDVRQQLQAKVQYRLGMRSSDVSVGHVPVANAQCVSCHAREEDVHPVHRFLEPRFADARLTLGVTECASCHQEHTGVRVTMPTGACASCHAELDLKQDPLDVPHSELTATGQWTSCLGCHDFHGNHRRTTQTQLADAYTSAAIMAYFDGGPSPYGTDLKFTTKDTP